MNIEKSVIQGRPVQEPISAGRGLSYTWRENRRLACFEMQINCTGRWVPSLSASPVRLGSQGKESINVSTSTGIFGTISRGSDGCLKRVRHGGRLLESLRSSLVAHRGISDLPRSHACAADAGVQNSSKRVVIIIVTGTPSSIFLDYRLEQICCPWAALRTAANTRWLPSSGLVVMQMSYHAATNKCTRES